MPELPLNKVKSSGALQPRDFNKLDDIDGDYRSRQTLQNLLLRRPRPMTIFPACAIDFFFHENTASIGLFKVIYHFIGLVSMRQNLTEILVKQTAWK